eukprot:5025874-Alexandrium_andersonii.AAC.1
MCPEVTRLSAHLGSPRAGVLLRCSRAGAAPATGSQHGGAQGALARNSWPACCTKPGRSSHSIC